jgi:hypothetical protein
VFMDSGLAASRRPGMTTEVTIRISYDPSPELERRISRQMPPARDAPAIAAGNLKTLLIVRPI